MRCCGQPSKVTHSYTAGRAGRTRRSICTKCHKCFTEVIVLLATEPGSGQGAYAVAQRLRAGQARLSVELVEKKGSQPS